MLTQVMCCDYGFRSGFGRLYQGEDGEIPKNIFQLVRPSAGSNSSWLAAARAEDALHAGMGQLQTRISTAEAFISI